MHNKLNSKGMTLVELIVSFMLVSVAMIYFFQTLRTVQSIYSKSIKEVNEFVNFDYAFRIIEAANNNEKNVLSNEVITLADVQSISDCSSEIINNINDIKCYEVKIGEKTKKIYLYPNNN